MSYQGILIRSALEGEPVRKFMRADPVTVRPDTTIDNLVNEYVYKYHFQMFPVTTNHKPLAYVTLEDIKNLPREEWRKHTVSELAQPISADNTIRLSSDAVKALSVMNRTGNDRLIVIDDTGQIAGVVTKQDLYKFLAVKLNIADEEINRIDKD